AAVVGGVEVAAGEGGGGGMARGASEYEHRVDREMGSIFDFGRNARRKIIPVAGGGGSGGGRWWPEMMREMEREI
ncbi:hypothetical protein Tco_0741951, partial [Tanacetum coccineum]